MDVFINMFFGFVLGIVSTFAFFLELGRRIKIKKGE